jgi:uncharacterized protein YciI
MQDMNDQESRVMMEHGAYWRRLMDQGKAIIFGPVLDPQGGWGLGVMETADQSELRALFADDPVSRSGLGFRLEVLPMAQGPRRSTRNKSELFSLARKRFGRVKLPVGRCPSGPMPMVVKQGLLDKDHVLPGSIRFKRCGQPLHHRLRGLGQLCGRSRAPRRKRHRRRLASVRPAGWVVRVLHQQQEVPAFVHTHTFPADSATTNHPLAVADVPSTVSATEPPPKCYDDP